MKVFFSILILNVIALIYANGGFSTKEIEQCIKVTNSLRKLHKDTEPLEWEPDLAAFAQKHADSLAESNNGIYHSGRAENLGENIYHKVGFVAASCAEATLSWYAEIKDYDFDVIDEPVLTDVGHFTQVVWKGTRLFGVGRATKTNKDGNVVTYIVANYYHKGNSYYFVDKKLGFIENVDQRKRGSVTPTLYDFIPCVDKRTDYKPYKDYYKCDNDDYEQFFKEMCAKTCTYCK